MTAAALDRPHATLWRAPWIMVGFTLLGLVALNILGWWIEVSPAIDRAAVVAAEPALDSIDRYLGFEFTGDSIGFGLAGVIAAFVLSRDRTNRFAWVLGTFFIGWMIAMALIQMLFLSIDGELPAAWAPWLGSLSAPPFLIFITGTFYTVAIFPNGRLVEGRWHRILSWTLGLWAIVAVARVFHPGPPYSPGATPYTFDNPFGLGLLSWFPVELTDIVSGALVLLTLASLVARYRSSGSEVRHQIKWVVVAGSLTAITSLNMELIETSWEGWPVMVAFWLLVGAIGVAITKYRLYDIDIVINRGLVFVGLAAFITAIYAAIVVGVGSLFSGSDLWLSIAAIALVAVVFEPVRARLQKWANRLVYGSRATPYEVLSDLTRRLAAAESEEGLLSRMAQQLSEGTGAERAVVWLADGAQFHAAAAAPPNGETQAQLSDLAALPGVAVPIEHEGATLGAVSVEKKRGDALTPTERRLIEDLAGSAGLVIRRLRLDEALAAKAAQLEESRRRLLDAQNVERRRLERDLHDGAQQHVVALRSRIDAAAELAADEDAEKAAALLGQLSSDAVDAIETMRDLARGIYPPVLEEEGLVAAIRTAAQRSPIPVAVDEDRVGRYDRQIEATVYFCVLEALQNTAKYANASRATVRLQASDGTLGFTVSDDGDGFDPATAGRGAGLTNMQDRLDATAGSLTIESEPGTGTTVIGSVPAVERMEVPA